MAPSLLDLPHELILKILVNFQSYHSYKVLLQTSKSLRKILREIIVVINDISDPGEDELVHFNLNQVSIEQMNQLIQRYDYFVFNLSCTNEVTDTIRLMKIILKNLQTRGTYHSITISNNHSSQTINRNPLIRFLLPKMNSIYAEFFFPSIRTINGFDDLRLLDNTNCYFDQLVRLTIGSFSFQLFSLKAPLLKTMNYSDQLKKRAFTESVSASKISYSKFLTNLSFTKELELLEIVNRVDPLTLNRFQNLRILRIYGDHVTKSFKLDFFENLKELVITKCYLFEEIWNLKHHTIVNSNLELLDLSNNKCFKQTIRGEFGKLKELNLSHTNITEPPQLMRSHPDSEGPLTEDNYGKYHIVVNLEGCSNLG